MANQKEAFREKHVTITLPSIENLKPQNNYVLCRRVGNNLTATTKSGIQKVSSIYSVDQFTPQNTERVFEVVSLPDELEEKFGFWKTQIDVQKGDIVIVEYYESMFSKVVMVGDQEYRFISYYKIITKVKDNELIPINGYLIFTQVKLSYGTFLHITDKMANVQDPRYGIIEYLSPANEYYTKDTKDNADKYVDVSKGDKVVFIMPLDRFAPPLEHKIHRILDKQYYYCHRFRIGAKFA